MSLRHDFRPVASVARPTVDGLYVNISTDLGANLRTVRDPELRRRLTPDYQPMCRRLIISAGFYRTMQRPDVDLVDTGIDHVDNRGIVTVDGTSHELDAIVLATGFDAHAFVRPMRLAGSESLTVDQLWEHGPKAHLGVALPGFPNFFMLMGPHSPVGNYPLTAIAESQGGHILRWIQRCQRMAPAEETQGKDEVLRGR